MLNQNLLLTGDDGYNIQRSLRFRNSASAYLSRTPASAGNRKTWTWSAWVKLGANSGDRHLIHAGNGTTNSGLQFDATNLRFSDYNSGSASNLVSSQVFRDHSAYYHIICAYDSTQATSSNRIKLYVNGSQITAFSTASYPTQNYDSALNNNVAHSIGAYLTSANFDGYLTDVHFIDGQALTPSSFGETDALIGVWKPKKYAGTYGTNGFFLNFSDNSAATAAAIGKDYSGNGNNWTPNNISVTVGATYDSMLDVPTLTSASAANYCVLNPLNRAYSTYTLSDGNLNWTSGTVNQGSFGTIQLPTSGKYYWEVVMTANAGGNPMIGIGGGTDAIAAIGAYYRTNGLKEQYSAVSGNGSFSYGATWAANDVIGIAYDADTSGGQITFYKNNSSQGVAFTGLTANFPNGLFAGFQNNATGTTTFQANFGQRPFAYTPPTGFVALNTFNLPEPSIKAGNKHFDINTYTGSGSAQNIVNSGAFKPDFIWFKGRGPSTNLGHALTDAVRGINLVLNSNNTDAEATDGVLTSFNSNGFTTGASSNSNKSGDSFVAWQWKANGAGSSNTAGSITSQVSANQNAGFSVVTWTAGSTAATIGHGLGVAPAIIIYKNRTTGGAGWNWLVYHQSIGATSALKLNLTDASAANSGAFNNTAPTSSVFSVGTGITSNGNLMVAYCFSEVAGYSKFGSYTGTGSTDGPFLYCGFRPRFLLIKRTDAARNWFIYDTARSPSNEALLELKPNLSDAEATSAASLGFDILSNGFKVRTNQSAYNEFTATYIFMALAENPFKYSLAR